MNFLFISGGRAGAAKTVPGGEVPADPGQADGGAATHPGPGTDLLEAGAADGGERTAFQGDATQPDTGWFFFINQGIMLQMF